MMASLFWLCMINWMVHYSAGQTNNEACDGVAGSYTLGFKVTSNETNVNIICTTRQRTVEFTGSFNDTSGVCIGYASFNNLSITFLYRPLSCSLYLRQNWNQTDTTIVVKKTTACAAGESQSIISGNLNHAVTSGDSVNITGCVYEHYTKLPIANSYWTLNESVILTKDFITSEDVGSTDGILKAFTLSPITVADIDVQSVYGCVVSLPMYNNTLFSKSYTFEGLGKAQFKSAPTTRSDKSTVISGCQYRSIINIPNDRIYLSFNGKKIYVKDSTDFITTSIRKFTTPDYNITSYNQVGIYKCGFDLVNGNTIESESLNVTMKMLSEPYFTLHPTALAYKKTGESIIISGCRIKAFLKFNTFNSSLMYQKDGYQLIRTTSEPKPPTQYPTTINFTDLVLTNTTFKDQGFYQCVIKINQQIYTSNKVYVKFEDVSSLTVQAVFSNYDYTNAYTNRTSPEFLQLYQNVNSTLTQQARKRDLVKDAKEKIFVNILSVVQGSVKVTAALLISGKSKEQRSKVCSTDETPFTIGDMNIAFQTTDCCPELTEGKDAYKGQYLYARTLIGEEYKTECKYHGVNKTFLTRSCELGASANAVWAKPNLEECLAKEATTNNLIALKKKSNQTCEQNSDTTTGDSCSKILETLTTIVNRSDVVKIPEDVTLIVSIISEVTQHAEFENKTVPETKKMTDDLLTVVDLLVAVNDSLMATAEESVQSDDERPLNTLLGSLDSFAAKIGSAIVNKTNTSITVEKSNMAFKLAKSFSKDITVYVQNNQSTSDAVIESEPKILNGNFTWLSSFYAKNLTELESAIYYSYFYREPTLFQGNDTDGKSRVVGSNILSFTISGKLQQTIKLSHPMNLTFTNTETINVNIASVNCSYWDFTNEEWSSGGCKLIDSNDRTTTCQCDHLTNFALLFNIAQMEPYNPESLQMITWIGCGLSLAGLSLTLMTYLFLKNLFRKLPSKILICLCLSMMALLITFLAGAERGYQPRIQCQVTASLIQYFLLSTFGWMAVEAFNMYRSLIIVFKGNTGQKKFMTFCAIAAWGGSGVIVLITGVAAPRNLGDHRFCFLIDYSFYFGIVLPIAIVLVFNTVIMARVMHVIIKKIKNNEALMSHHILRKEAKIALTLSCLLGVTWLFGFLAFNKATIAFQWIFAIFNSLQGFFIFLFHTVLAQDAQKELTRKFSSLRHRLKTYEDVTKMTQVGSSESYENTPSKHKDS